MSYPSRVPQHRAQILAILNGTQEALTLKEIARTMDVAIPRMWDLARLMVAEQSMHVARTHSSTRYYRPGPSTGAASIGPTVEARILAALAEKPMTAGQLGAHLGISKSHLCHVINSKLRAPGQPKQVYIRKYVKQANVRPMLYDVGNRPDAKRPAPITQAEKSRRARVRMRADEDKREAMLKKDRFRKIQPKADPFMAQFAGLFGERRAA